MGVAWPPQPPHGGMIGACADVVGRGVMPDAMYGVPTTEAKTRPFWRWRGWRADVVADVVADAYAVVKLRASVDGTDAEYSIVQMSEVRVTKWSLFDDEFSNLLRERDC